MKTLYRYTRPNGSIALLRSKNKEEAFNYWKQFNSNLKMSDIAIAENQML